MKFQESPCLTCTKVPIPSQCENKNCVLWRKWFLRSWENIRSYPRKRMDLAPTKPMGVPLGGRHYAHPHRIREYINSRPCDGCCAKTFCKSPCKVLTNWLHEGGKQ